MKILVVRFSSIGDIVLTTPVIRCLHQITGVEVHFLTKKPFTSLLDANPYIEKTYAINKKIKEVLPLLKGEKYDCIIDLHRNIRTLKLTFALGVKTFRFNKLNAKKWLLTKFHINKLPNTHIVDRYMHATKSLGIKNDGKGLDFFIPSNQIVDKKHLPSAYIALVIGAAHATKRLPLTKLIALCNAINSPIVLIGGPSDKEVGEKIKAQTGSHITNTCGHFSIHQSASILQQSEGVITHDTGMMHIASALQKKIVSIWGNTVPAFGMYPYYGQEPNKNTNIEVLDLSCRPCSKIGHSSCPKKHFKCMEEIPVNKIKAQVDLFL